MTDQNSWIEYTRRHGDVESKKELARQLRLFADIIDADGYPDVFSAKIMETGAVEIDGLMQKISVTLSYPWPG